MNRLIFLLSLLFFLSNCENTPENTTNEQEQTTENNKVEKKKKERPSALENGKFFKINDQQMLFGGENENEHFNITDCELKQGQFHYGIGRETFPALLQPEFISVQEADSIWNDSARFLLVYTEKESKAYSIKDLTHHEVVNDVLDGEPIMAAYCILADLGAIYRRNYGENELTFALSGYTYFDKEVWKGLDGFVLWDRETESLWWPLVGKAVSGPLKETTLIEMDLDKWKDVKWKYIKDNYPNAQVLKSGQDFERPSEWNNKVDTSYIRKNYASKK